jgi:glycosyltransferase involved in cell wall biosynthesis
MLDTIDLYSQNVKMCHALNQYLPFPPIDAEEVDPILVDEEFFSRFDVTASSEEYWICDQYNYTIAIAPDEAQAIHQHCQNTAVAYLPMTVDTPPIQNTYTGDPLFAVGPNPFNLQGYCYFVQKVLPGVLEKFPEFNLRVFGSSCQDLIAAPGTELLGFVPDLTPLYTEGRFAICPLIGGTGQKVKITEAMAYGVPVITLRNAAEGSPIESGVNGFIAENAEEFTQYTLHLLQDQELCRQLGEAARETIRQNLSEQRLIEQLSSLLNHSGTVLGQRSQKRFPTVVVDAVVFQIAQTTGIARIWRAILEQWSETDFAQHVVVLDRGGTAPRLTGLRYRAIHRHDTIECCDAHTPSDHATGLDPEILQAICDEESADLFISTYYTTPISTPSVFMGYDMIPEILNVDLNAPVWQEKRYSILYASHYITISESTSRDLRRFFPYIEPSQIKVAHCGWDPLFSPASPEEIETFKANFVIEKPYFLLVGDRVGYGGHKNSMLLFQALNQIQPKEKFSVLCVGGQPELESELHDLAKGITLHLVHLGNEELRVAYSGAVALVYPSRHEGFGLPIVEAMACGCPVITCRTASIPEVAGEAALYVDPFNPDELGIALEAVQEPNAREDLRNRGLAQVQRFSWTKMAEGIAETITRIAKDMNYNSLKQQDWIWSEFRKSQRERSTLQQQNQSLQEHNQSLQEHYQSLQKDNQSLQKDNQSLQKDNQSLQKDNQSLQETYQSLLQYHHSVEETYQSLLQQHESLQQQHESLQQQHESLQQQNQLLHQHIAAMESSKFWKIRTSWVRLKELVGSATTDEVSR